MCDPMLTQTRSHGTAPTPVMQFIKRSEEAQVNMTRFVGTVVISGHKVDYLRSFLVVKLNYATSLEELYFNNLKDRMEELSSIRSISDEQSKEFVVEARQRLEESTMIRQIRDEYIELTDAIDNLNNLDNLDSQIRNACKKIINKLDSLADYAEDCSEALALSAHGPFRDLVKSELQAIGIK